MSAIQFSYVELDTLSLDDAAAPEVQSQEHAQR